MSKVLFYILDNNLEHMCEIELYESFIWTERYDSFGDFELYAFPSNNLLTYAIKDNYVFKSDSNRLMIIEETELKESAENGIKILVKGRSLEILLERRVAYPNFKASGTIEKVVEELLKKYIINPAVSQRKISNFEYRNSNDPFLNSTNVDITSSGDSLLEIMAGLCGMFSIGYSITLVDKKFVFSLYNGVDRTYEQQQNPHVIFSYKHDNLSETNNFESLMNFKNVAIVAGEDILNNRRSVTLGNDNSGLLRRELFIDARDIQSEGENENLIAPDFDSVTLFNIEFTNLGDGTVKLYGTPDSNRFHAEKLICTIPYLERGYYEISGVPGRFGDVYDYYLKVNGVGEINNQTSVEHVYQNPGSSDLIVDNSIKVENDLRGVEVRVAVEAIGHDLMYKYVKFEGDSFDNNIKYYEVVGKRFIKTSDQAPFQTKVYFAPTMTESYEKLLGNEISGDFDTHPDEFFEISNWNYVETKDKAPIPGKVYRIEHKVKEYTQFSGSEFTPGKYYFEKYGQNYFITGDTTPIEGKQYYTRTYRKELYGYTNITSFSPFETYYELDSASYRLTQDDYPIPTKTYYRKIYLDGFSVFTGSSFDNDMDYYELEDARFIETSDQAPTTYFGEKKNYFYRVFDRIDEEFTPVLKRVRILEEDYDELLVNRGREKLPEYYPIKYFDGETEEYQFKYGEDYFMGDILQIENTFNVGNKVRVVEHISSFENGAIKNIPTFKII